MPQVLGLTEYSQWPEAKAVRQCAQQHGSVRRKLSALAQKRLRAMMHVGVMERMDDSITSLAVGGACALPPRASKPQALRAVLHMSAMERA